jgi:hypothetical protein
MSDLLCLGKEFEALIFRQIDYKGLEKYKYTILALSFGLDLFDPKMHGRRNPDRSGF